MPTGVYKRTLKHRLQISKSLKGRMVSEKTKDKIRQSHIGRKVSKEVRQKLSVSHKGQRPWNKGLKTGLAPWKGKKRPPFSLETKVKMSKARIGKKLSIEVRQKISRSKLKGEASPDWVGDKISYSGLHNWLVRKYGKPKICEFCGEEEKRLQWASINHQYKRDLNTWLSLCVSCHRKYDRRDNPSF